MKKIGLSLKIVFFALLLTVGVRVSAQKKLGDYIEFGGVPAFVFYTDQTGEHGLAMSIPAFDAKSIKKTDKLVKRGLITAEQATIFKNNPLGKYNSQGCGGKKSEELFAGLIDRLTDNGQINQEQIIAYCEEKSISLQEKFPMQYWAQNLGEGWFIPGDDELTEFAKFYFGGLGRKHSLGIKFLHHAKDLCSNELIQESLYRMVYFGLFSSSCHHAGAGFRKLRCETVVLTGKNYFEFFDTATTNNSMVCAVHEF